MHRVTHKVIDVRPLSRATFALRVTREGFAFTAGQCVSLGIPSAAVNREYSIYSGEKDEFLEFLVREVEGGTVSPRLKKLSSGAAVDVNGPFGTFSLKDTFRDRPHFFIASGTGIAPFHSIIRSAGGLNYRVVHGVRVPDEAYDREHYGANTYFPCFSKEKGPGFYGRVTEFIADHPLEPDAVFYLCGNKAMINDVYDVLRRRKIPTDSIFTEVFF